MKINVYSKEHKKDHIVISGKDFKKILDEDSKAGENKDLISAGLKRITEPENIENEPNDIVRNIEYALYLSSIAPIIQ
ncbi:MAG: hypothetical protein Q8R18_06240 [bacterium]|nr:hypothetical protein [bacterium]